MDIIDRTIKREGGYVDHPSDPGGATKYGITLKTLRRHVPRATKGHVWDLTKEDARKIYAAEYLKAPKIDQIQDPWLREVLFDIGVLHGPGRAVRFLQRALGLTTDGIIGPRTLGEVNGLDVVAQTKLGLAVVTIWCRYLSTRVQDGKSSPDFIGGWIKRATSHLETLL